MCCDQFYLPYLAQKWATSLKLLGQQSKQTLTLKTLIYDRARACYILYNLKRARLCLIDHSN